MRELTEKEVNEISGGVGPVGAIITGIGSGLVAAMNGGNAGQIAASATLGAVAGFFGSIAGATTGLTRYMFGGFAIETEVLSGMSSS